MVEGCAIVDCRQFVVYNHIAGCTDNNLDMVEGCAATVSIIWKKCLSLTWCPISFTPVYGEVYWIQYYVIRFVSDLQ
jgi:hypothetical protein